MLIPRLRQLLSVLGLCFLLLIALRLGPCRRRPAVDPGHPAPQPVALKTDQRAKVIIDTRRREVRYAVRRSSGVVESKIIEEVRRATIVVKDTGEVEVVARRWGFCFEPGLALAVEEGPKPAGDLQYFYWGHWGALAGLYYNDNLRLYVGGSYELGRLHLFNTSLWTGVNLQKEIVFGLRVGF